MWDSQRSAPLVTILASGIQSFKIIVSLGLPFAFYLSRSRSSTQEPAVRTGRLVYQLTTF